MLKGHKGRRDGHKVRPEHVGHGARFARRGVFLTGVQSAAGEQAGERLAGAVRYS